MNEMSSLNSGPVDRGINEALERRGNCTVAWRFVWQSAFPGMSFLDGGNC